VLRASCRAGDRSACRVKELTGIHESDAHGGHVLKVDIDEGTLDADVHQRFQSRCLGVAESEVLVQAS
jgi:hypothetical protein